MRHIQIDADFFYLAECWDDLCAAVLPEVIYLSVILPQVDDVNGWSRMVCLCLCTNEKHIHAVEKWWKNLRLHPDDFQKLKELCAWAIDTRCLRKPYDKLRVGSMDFLLPNPDIDNYSFIEIAMAGVKLDAMRSLNMVDGEPDSEHAEELACDFMSVWLRQKEHWIALERKKRSTSWNGDMRRDFAESKLAELSKRLRKMSVFKKVVVLRYLQDIFIEFIEDFKDVFGTDKKNEPRYPDGRGWLFVPKPLIEKGVVRDIDAAYAKSSGEVFGWLRDISLDVKEMQNTKE